MVDIVAVGNHRRIKEAVILHPGKHHTSRVVDKIIQDINRDT